MICLTGDVHNRSRASADQAAVGYVSDVALAERYARIAEQFGVAVTLFTCGRVAEEEPATLSRVAATGRVEIAAHEFDPLRWQLPRRIARKGLRTLHALPATLQRREMRHARRAFAALGIEARSWRGHAYRRDRRTAALLAAEGYTHFSGWVDSAWTRPRPLDGVIALPINTTPDHEHVLHPTRRPPSVYADPISPAEWLSRVQDEVPRIEAAGGVATILAHPTCMAAIDDFAVFRRLCAFLAERETGAVSQVELAGAGATVS